MRYRLKVFRADNKEPETCFGTNDLTSFALRAGAIIADRAAQLGEAARRNKADYSWSSEFRIEVGE